MEFEPHMPSPLTAEQTTRLAQRLNHVRDTLGVMYGDSDAESSLNSSHRTLIAVTLHELCSCITELGHTIEEARGHPISDCYKWSTLH